MKYFLLLFALALSLLACSSETDTMPFSAPHLQVSQSELYLNQGRKWKADAATTASMQQLQALLAEFDKGNFGQIPDAYQDLGKEFDSTIGPMLLNCQMKGEGHNQLHRYLAPLMEDVAVLQESDYQAAALAKQRISSRLQLFGQYFE